MNNKIDYNNLLEVDEAALWMRTSQAGVEYLSGTVTVNGENYRLVMFENPKKEDGDKRPKWQFNSNKEIK